jgi:hypothetical protein
MLQEPEELERALRELGRVRCQCVCLAATEMLEPVLERGGEPGWYARLVELRQAMWNALCDGAALDPHAAPADALCLESAARLHRDASDPVVATYGVAANAIACLLPHAATGDPGPTAFALFDAVGALLPIYFPDKHTWTGEELSELRAHPSQLTLRQGLEALMRASAPTPTHVTQSRADAQAIARALAPTFPAP